MIAQRKPNQDKGFEDLRGSGVDNTRKSQLLCVATSNSGLKPSMDGAWRWFLPTFGASIPLSGELRARTVTFDPGVTKTPGCLKFLRPSGSLA
jgi:hypothetical protein